MSDILFEGKHYTRQEQETVLDCLVRHGVEIPCSCRSGICQSCLMRAVRGTLPAAAQAGLKDTLHAQGYFLPCVCKPESDLEAARPGEGTVCHTPAQVDAKERLNQDIVRLRLRCRQPFPYRPGQFLHLHRHDGLLRSYSIASLPQEGDTLELHIRHLPGGQMSEWIKDGLEVGDTLELSGPSGNCFYMPGEPEQGILLIGTGSGLAPLWGILRDALAQGHQGPIALFHGSWEPAGLYLVEELRALAAQHPNFTYMPCVDAGALPGYETGRADQVALKTYPRLAGWRVYLCGHPEMVQSAKKKAFLSGASMKDIYADPFVLSKPPAPPAAFAA